MTSISTDIRPREYEIKNSIQEIRGIGCEDIIQYINQIYNNWASIHDLINFSLKNKDTSTINSELEEIKDCKNTKDMMNQIDKVIEKILNIYHPSKTNITIKNSNYKFNSNYYKGNINDLDIYYLPNKNIIYKQNYDSILKYKPEDIIGKRIKILWKNNTHFAGKISKYNKKNKTYTVEYDDGDVREYNMELKQWYFEKDETNRDCVITLETNYNDKFELNLMKKKN